MLHFQFFNSKIVASAITRGRLVSNSKVSFCKGLPNEEKEECCTIKAKEPTFGHLKEDEFKLLCEYTLKGNCHAVSITEFPTRSTRAIS
ncbi:hypothetical protein SUGI_0999380 [Cryptomeria japonica]|nr:hypothetical protein SUGI_0999380 [Cryptomeria japonica]